MTGLAGIPSPRTLWRSVVVWAWLAYAALTLAPLPHAVVQYWFHQSLGFEAMFWTNFRAQALMFVVFGAVLFVATWFPLRVHARSADLRNGALHVGVWLATLGGWLYAQNYQQALLATHRVSFGSVDPVFGNDIGFYVFTMPFWQTSLRALQAALLVGLAAALLGRWDALSTAAERKRRLPALLGERGLIGTPMTNLLMLALGVSLALQTFLNRFGLLFRDNDASGVRTGADYLDVTGLISSLNFVYVTAVVELTVTLAVCYVIHRAYRGKRLRDDNTDVTAEPRRTSWKIPVRVGAVALAVELVFYGALVIRDHVLVSPNEPVIQREYIQRHMDATLRGFRLDRVEVHEWQRPATALTADAILASKTVQNAPVVSSWVSHLELPSDVHHYERFPLSQSSMVFGPVLHVYEQQQQLRPYYRFLSIDGARYSVGGQKQMFASAVRELPSIQLVGAQEWLRYWGSAALQFTHGMGLVMSPVNQVDAAGNPVFVSRDVPPVIDHPELAHEARIYFGEGARENYVLTKAQGLREFDYATDQSRAEFSYPENVQDGIRINSPFRRLVFALYTGDLTAFLFSRYISRDSTRIHIRRTPITRATTIAPFLFLDSNINAFVANGNVLWMINGLTTSDRYPYAYREMLGDKADERAVEDVPQRRINYAEDAVKITVDAYSGQIRFYRIADDPIAEAWQRVYPSLFTPGTLMPPSVKSQLTYPLQWFHVQFDDIYKRYHQRDPIEFYNVEDLWDDADEVLGSIGRGLTGYGTEDQMTFSYEGYNALLDPADLPRGVNIGAPGDLQYAMLMPFTPEGAKNLRSLIVALQDPGQYGRLLSLQIPQGTFVAGPEQVDAYVDNNRPVHQQVTMWIRHASEVIRGSTLLLPVRGDLLYVEPIWVNSLQNNSPQLKLFALRYNDEVTSGATLAEAILARRALEQPPARLPLPAPATAKP